MPILSKLTFPQSNMTNHHNFPSLKYPKLSLIPFASRNKNTSYRTNPTSFLNQCPTKGANFESKVISTAPLFLLPSEKDIKRDNLEESTSRDIDALLSTSVSSGYGSGYSSDSSLTCANFCDTDYQGDGTLSENSPCSIIPHDDQIELSDNDTNSCDTVIAKNERNFASENCKSSFQLYFNNIHNSDTRDRLHDFTSLGDESIHREKYNVTLNKIKSLESSYSCAAHSLKLGTTPRRRIKDNEGFIRRAACVCVNEDESKVILISSKHEGGGWLLPGGGLEPGEKDYEAAVREAWEEAGIVGHVKRCLGVFQLEDGKSHKKKRTTVFVLEVEELRSDFPEAELGRKSKWFSIELAIDHLSQYRPHQIDYLQTLLDQKMML